MALIPDELLTLDKRQTVDNGNGNCYYDYNNQYVCGNSAWADWVRWVVLAVIIILFMLVFVACSCVSARRRRQRGHQPYYGTGWVGGRWAHPQNQNGSRYAHYGQPQQFAPAPPYSANPPDYANNNNAGYFGGQQSGIELGTPQRAYQADGGAYVPPVGPPPGKKGDAVIR